MRYLILYFTIISIIILNSCSADDSKQPTDRSTSTSVIENPIAKNTTGERQTDPVFVFTAPNTSQEITTEPAAPVVDLKADTEVLLMQRLHEIIQITKSEYWMDNIVLAENVSQIKSAIAGDLNKDGNDDLVVVVEFAIKNEYDETKPEFSFGWGSPRTIYILLGNADGSYRIAHKNEALILENGMGGRFGEPLVHIKIENGVLEIAHIQGTSWSWYDTMCFSYDNNGQLTLISSMQDCYWSVGPNNETTTCDFVNHRLERCSRSSPWKEGSEKLLLYSGELPNQAFLFDDVTCNEISNLSYIRFLPDWGNYLYDGFQEQSHTPYELKITPSQALDMAMVDNYPDFEKVYISYTQENKDNYFTLLFYETPDYYYKGKDGLLIYKNVENLYPDKLQHRIQYYPFYDKTIKDNSIVIEDK
ncbi:MAG: hypothetical protein AB9835_10080 [Eubacteriales bacterium]